MNFLSATSCAALIWAFSKTSKIVDTRLRYIVETTGIISLTSFNQCFENFVFLGEEERDKDDWGKKYEFPATVLLLPNKE